MIKLDCVKPRSHQSNKKEPIGIYEGRITFFTIWNPKSKTYSYRWVSECDKCVYTNVTSTLARVFTRLRKISYD